MVRDPGAVGCKTGGGDVKQASRHLSIAEAARPDLVSGPMSDLPPLAQRRTAKMPAAATRTMPATVSASGKSAKTRIPHKAAKAR
jgi:hypothetical protein